MISPLIQVLSALAAVGSVWAVQRWRGRRADQEARPRRLAGPARSGWDQVLDAPEALGLIREGAHLRGARDGLELRILPPSEAAGLTLELPGLPDGLHLSSAGVDAVDHTGDKIFDIKYSMLDEFAQSGGALGVAGRAALVALLPEVSHVTARAGLLRVVLSRWVLDRADPVETLRRVLGLCARVREALGEGAGAGWLARAARQDPCAGVRLRALRALAEGAPWPEVEAVARALLAEEPDEEVRGEAALLLGEVAPLGGLGAAALARLVERHPAALCALAEREGDEALLLAMLRTQADRVGVELVGALGRVGSPAAIPALRRLAEGARGSAVLRAAALEAVARIEGRGDELAGGLSVAEVAGGGRLSVPAGPGTLELSPEAGGVSVVGTGLVDKAR